MNQKQRKKNFKRVALDDYERELEEFLNRGEYRSAESLKEIKRLFQAAAKNHLALQRSKRITIRINYQDLLRVKAKAKRNRIPYQTLLGTLIHQYAEDRTQIGL